MNKDISKTLADFFKKKGLDYEWEAEEHPGCWDKGCSHDVNVLHTWRKGIRKFGWAFDEGCRDEMIMETLENRLKEKPPYE